MSDQEARMEVWYARRDMFMQRFDVLLRLAERKQWPEAENQAKYLAALLIKWSQDMDRYQQEDSQ